MSRVKTLYVVTGFLKLVKPVGDPDQSFSLSKRRIKTYRKLPTNCPRGPGAAAGAVQQIVEDSGANVGPRIEVVPSSENSETSQTATIPGILREHLQKMSPAIFPVDL